MFTQIGQQASSWKGGFRQVCVCGGSGGEEGQVPAPKCGNIT